MSVHVRPKFSTFAFVLASAVIAACSGGTPGGGLPAPGTGGIGGTGGTGGEGGEGAESTATPVGEPMGRRATAVIGPAGGTLTSLDERLTLDIPAGALATDTEIGVEPITSTGWGGLTGYRLTPDGQKFAAPITLAFRYEDAWLLGGSPSSLGIAYQAADGRWFPTGTPLLDEENATVSVATDHFTDENLVELWTLSPRRALVKTGDSVGFAILYNYGFKSGNPADDILGPLTPYKFLPIAKKDLVEWGVQQGGTPVPGSAGLGTFDLLGNGTFAYFAPNTAPSPPQVTVFAKSKDGKRSAMADVLIEEKYQYTGYIDFRLAIGGVHDDHNNVSELRTRGRIVVNFPTSTVPDKEEYSALPEDTQLSLMDATWNYLDIDKQCWLQSDAPQGGGHNTTAQLVIDKTQHYTVGFQVMNDVTRRCVRRYEDGNIEYTTELVFLPAQACVAMLPPIPTYSDKGLLEDTTKCSIGATGKMSWFLVGKK